MTFVRVAVCLLTILNVALAAMWLFTFKNGGYYALDKPTVEYKDFVSILLTALAAMIALAALAVGAAAIWTYGEAKKIIHGAADSAAREIATKVAAAKAEEVAMPVATEVATAVATRVARGTGPAETEPQEAADIVRAVASETEEGEGQARV